MSRGGKNDNKTVRSQAIHRARYASECFKRNGIKHKAVKEFNFSEFVQYGRIDLDDDPVIPKSSKLKPIEPPAKKADMHFVVEIVKKRFKIFKRRFDQAVLVGQIASDDPFLSAMKIHKGYANPVVLYKDFVAGIMETFNGEYLGLMENRKQVMNFTDYVDHFLRFIEILGQDFPVTLTGFQKSKNSNIFTSGLAISIADLDASVDQLKETFFELNPCIDFYLNLAQQHGFSVVQNAPWILVLDLDHPTVRKEILVPADNVVANIFKRNYSKTYIQDINLLSDIIRKSYNSWVTNFPYKKDINICKKNISVKNIYRERLSSKVFNNKYNISYWIPQYIKIRNFEESYPYTDPEIFRMTEKAFSFQKLLDNNNAMRYINEQYRVKYKLAHGGLLFYHKWAQQRKTEDE
jgi:hypothetical protein